MIKIDLDDDRIIELYKTKSANKIGKIIGVSQATIYRRLEDNNIKIIYKKSNLSEEHKRNISVANKGNIFSKEHKQNLSKSRKKQIPPMLGKHHSEEGKCKISNSRMGELNWRWNGGITPLRHKIRNSNEYQEWRLMVFGRDNFTCKKCGKRGCYLEAHHIKKFSSIIQYLEITTKENAFNCEALWNINNGITLCEECHKKLRGDNNGCN